MKAKRKPRIPHVLVRLHDACIRWQPKGIGIPAAVWCHQELCACKEGHLGVELTWHWADHFHLRSLGVKERNKRAHVAKATCCHVPMRGTQCGLGVLALPAHLKSRQNYDALCCLERRQERNSQPAQRGRAQKVLYGPNGTSLESEVPVLARE